MLKSKIQRSLIIIGIAAVLGLILFAGGAVVGYQYYKGKALKTAVKHQRREASAVDKIIDTREKEAKKYENIRTVVRKATDPSGCLDVVHPESGAFARGLRNANRRGP